MCSRPIRLDFTEAPSFLFRCCVLQWDTSDRGHQSVAERSWAFSSSKFFMAHRRPHKTNKQTKVLPKGDSAPRPQDTTCKPACSFLCGWGHLHFLPRHLRDFALTDRPFGLECLVFKRHHAQTLYHEGDFSLNITQLFLSPSPKDSHPTSTTARSPVLFPNQRAASVRTLIGVHKHLTQCLSHSGYRLRTFLWLFPNHSAPRPHHLLAALRL